MIRLGRRGVLRPLTEIQMQQKLQESAIRFSSSSGQKIMAIRRETQSVWERRAPLAPNHVRQLVKKGVKVLVQPSNRRAYPMRTYADAGARIQEDISEASCIFGVKQVPVDCLIRDKTFCFFSHTIKAQSDNMDLMDAMLEKNVRCVDYEKLEDATGKRVVAFGKYAGIAGMIDILNGLGLRMLALGHHTPFMHIGPAHAYRNSHHARQGIRDAGYEVSLGMMPKSVGPMTFVFTGSGNVSQGAQEVFQELPHEYVTPSMLKKVAEKGDTNKLYACEIRRSDQFERKAGGGYNEDEFNEFPERYVCNFSHKFAPYSSVIINGIYWSPQTPRLLSIPDAKMLLTPPSTPWIGSSSGCPNLPHRLVAICDISADPGGSIEFMNECTSIDEPFCLYDAEQNKDKVTFKGDGVLICSIDNMPTQLPREATDYFGDLLLPHVENIIKNNAKKPFDDKEKEKIGPIVAGAVITTNGKLAPNFEYIAKLREEKSVKISGDFSSDKKALVLGAGYVSAPVIEYLTRDKDLGVTVAAAIKSEADAVAMAHERTEPVLLDINERPDKLADLIKSHDIVVSLLPWTLHPIVAKAAIAGKTNMVTASYLSDGIKDLHQDAVDAGVTIVNECGVDPGIDHFLAMECFDNVHDGAGKIESFVSFCGGLPAPENSDNPLGYKFSWSPRGALLNMLSGARYLEDGVVVDIEDNGGLMDAANSMDFLPGFSLEGYPNRDSTIYTDLYGIREAHTVLRGTLRYKGYTKSIKGMANLGLLDANPTPVLHENGPDLSWRQYMCHLTNQDEGIFKDNLREILLERLGDKKTLKTIEELGFLSDEPIVKCGSPLDTMSTHLSGRLNYGKGERDMILMRHEVLVRWPDGRRELKGINLVNYGDPNGYTAMAKTVGYPCAIATKMVLDGEIQRKGAVLPFTKDIYRPMLQRLAKEGITGEEKSTFF